MPEAEGRNHVIEVADNDGPGLYLTIGLPGKEAAPHDHGVWCVNTAIAGRERHVLWRRTDDGSKSGYAAVAKIGAVMVEPGHGFAMADHDIHSTEVVGDEPAISLAVYGYALVRFPSVVWYHPEFSSVRPMHSRRGMGAACADPNWQYRRDHLLCRRTDDPTRVVSRESGLSLWLRQRQLRRLHLATGRRAGVVAATQRTRRLPSSRLSPDRRAPAGPSHARTSR